MEREGEGEGGEGREGEEARGGRTGEGRERRDEGGGGREDRGSERGEGEDWRRWRKVVEGRRGGARMRIWRGGGVGGGECGMVGIST